MSKKLLLPLLLCLFTSQLFSQSNTPVVLDQPESWAFEKIDFPLGFAQDIPFEGFEELRFAPDWYKRDSPNYFTYAFALSLENKAKLKQQEITQFLTSYYKGLCEAVAEGKDFKVDISQITVELKKQGKGRYHAEVLFFDSFNQGEAVQLHMEIRVYSDKKANASTVMTLVSSKGKGNPIWKELREIRAQVEKKLDR